MNTPNNPRPAGSDNERLPAIISYLTLVGWIIAYVMYNNDKRSLTLYHLRQSLALIVLGVLVYTLQSILYYIPWIGWLLSIVTIPVGLGLFILWIIGLISAINGEEKPIPLIGEKAQEIFSSIR